MTSPLLLSRSMERDLTQRDTRPPLYASHRLSPPGGEKDQNVRDGVCIRKTTLILNKTSVSIQTQTPATKSVWPRGGFAGGLDGRRLPACVTPKTVNVRFNTKNLSVLSAMPTDRESDYFTY